MSAWTPRAGAWHHATPRTCLNGAWPGRPGVPGGPPVVCARSADRQKSVVDVVLVDVDVTDEAVELDELDVLEVLVVVVTQSTSGASWS